MIRLLVIEWSNGPDDHRPLGVSGTFLSGAFSEADVATFTTQEAAQSAIASATNRRPGSSVSIIGQARRAA